nr:immunoglobulin light chain junction region [Macaca mulatta]
DYFGQVFDSSVVFF